MKFQIGDVVQLKSGGPLMTVTGDNGDRVARCKWFDGSRPMAEIFHEDSLEKVATEQGRVVVSRPGLSASRG